MTNRDKNNLHSENQQKGKNQEEILKSQESEKDTGDQQINNEADDARIRSERQRVKDAEKNQSRH
ncbi:MAG: hypothetical protein H0V91_08260 [Flavisolibacter sp.]|jgi:hypothetical protein|nr:hypothetical protein [Flavisolibacter sp.]